MNRAVGLYYSTTAGRISLFMPLHQEASTLYLLWLVHVAAGAIAMFQAGQR